MRRHAIACALAIGMAAGAHADEARYLVSGELLPIRMVANGYVQELHDRRDGAVVVSVSTSMVPLEVDAAYTLPEAAGNHGIPSGFQLPTTLRQGLRSDSDSWSAATRILEWVAGNLRLEVDNREPQDAASVLYRGSGRCSGLANATAALLMTAGFEARTVSGLLVSEDGPIPHRWVNCKIPGAGWVPTDPTLGLWVVSSRHLAFAETVSEAPVVHVLAMQEDGIDALPLRGRLPLRPNRGSELVCRLEHSSHMASAVVTLYGASGQTHRAQLNPEARFRGLLPGEWHMVVSTPDGEVLQRLDLHLEAGRVHSMTVSVPEA